MADPVFAKVNQMGTPRLYFSQLQRHLPITVLPHPTLTMRLQQAGPVFLSGALQVAKSTVAIESLGLSGGVDAPSGSVLTPITRRSRPANGDDRALHATPEPLSRWWASCPRIDLSDHLNLVAVEFIGGDGTIGSIPCMKPAGPLGTPPRAPAVIAKGSPRPILLCSRVRGT